MDISTRARWDTQGGTARALSVARAIPGLHLLDAAVVRKPCRSVTVTDRQPIVNFGIPPQPGRSRSALSTVAEVALPTPLVNGSRYWLLMSILTDLLVVVLGLVIVHIPLAAKHGSWRDPWPGLVLLWNDLASNDLGLILVYGALITLLSYSEGVFHAAGHRWESPQLGSLSKSVAWATVLLAAAIEFSGCGTISRGMLLGSAVLNLAGMHGRRVFQQRLRAKRAATNSGAKNVIIIGASGLGQRLALYLEVQGSARKLCGFIDQNVNNNPRVLGPVEDLACIARSQFADEIIIAVPHEGELARTAIVEAMRNHLDVWIVPDLFGYAPSHTTSEQVGPFPLIPLHEEPIPEFGLVLKRGLDLVLSFVALTSLMPLLALISAAIKIDSAGPVFYRAPRAGKKGRQFLCWKFRTMVASADEVKDQLRQRNERQGPIFKIRDDPRITRVGRFLRRYSLDELPQLWNVLKGEMSLVGPRPHPLDDYQRYELEHLRRLDVTPGITGLWQIIARRDSSFNRNMALDLEYIDRWSVWLDLQILFKTCRVVFAGTGA